MTTIIEKSGKPTATTPRSTSVAADQVRFPTLHHIFALTKRGLLKTMRTPEALIDVTIQPIIFLLLFTYLFGGAMMGSTADYLQFLLPGIYVQSILFSAVAIGVNLNQDVTKGVTDRFRSLPISRSAPLIGAVTSDVLRYLVLSASLLITGFIMGFRVETSIWAMFGAVALAIGFSLCLCWVSVFVGMLARSPGAVQGILFLAIFPLTFGSNVFVQTDTMPGWLQAFVKVNPATSLADATRGLLSGGPVASPLLYCLLWMAGLLAVFFPLAVRAYRRRV
ncbi:ABC transporter permease [Nakamurella silvestris]|nr:ABC transporter permease [Nakamurella silvestris]